MNDAVGKSDTGVRRRYVLTIGASGAGAALLAACGAGRQASSPAPAAAPATIRTLTRTEYDEPAWKAFSESSGGITVQTEPGPDTTKDYGAKVLALAAAGSA